MVNQKTYRMQVQGMAGYDGERMRKGRKEGRKENLMLYDPNNNPVYLMLSLLLHFNRSTRNINLSYD